MALIIFDLDGTLLDSIEGLAVSMNAVLKEFELESHPIERYKSFVGNGIEKLVEAALGEENITLLEEALRRMIHHYKSLYMVGLEAYDGIYALLDAIMDSGHEMALVTNKFQFMADVIMTDFFSDYPFLEVIGRSDDYPAKPDPTMMLKIIEENGYDKSQTYMVGDTEVDLIVARNAGINEVFVSWGFRELKAVSHLEPKTVIHKPSDLLSVLDKKTIEGGKYD